MDCTTAVVKNSLHPKIYMLSEVVWHRDHGTICNSSGEWSGRW